MLTQSSTRLSASSGLNRREHCLRQCVTCGSMEKTWTCFLSQNPSDCISISKSALDETTAAREDEICTAPRNPFCSTAHLDHQLYQLKATYFLQHSSNESGLKTLYAGGVSYFTSGTVRTERPFASRCISKTTNDNCPNPRAPMSTSFLILQRRSFKFQTVSGTTIDCNGTSEGHGVPVGGASSNVHSPF